MVLYVNISCKSSKSKQATFWTRDRNSAQLALNWMSERTRPVAFCRVAGLARTEEEKTGQSVDLRRRRASEPALNFDIITIIFKQFPVKKSIIDKLRCFKKSKHYQS